MKKTILSIILIVLALNINSQSLEIEKEAISLRIKSGKMTGVQAQQILKKWNNFTGPAGFYPYPDIKADTANKTIEITEILSFTNPDRKAVFQRCLQWMATNYFVVAYSDFESGKIIANGSLNLTHREEYLEGFGSKVRPRDTQANYTLVLTFKGSKIKYSIQDISFTFNNYSETIDQITFPIYSLFPIILQEQIQWVKFISLLNETNDKFSNKLKNSLIEYVNEAENDYNF